tara:strand:- start:1112 stop:1474 length:363 start_codon:yes stop_codon:yes gene_type:complete
MKSETLSIINKSIGEQMPNYTFFNEESGIEWDEFMSIADKEEYLSNNSNTEQVIKAMNIVGGVGGIKNDDGWGEVMHKVSAAHPNSALAASMGSKQTTKEVKTRKAVDKWRSKRIARGDA